MKSLLILLSIVGLGITGYLSLHSGEHLPFTTYEATSLPLSFEVPSELIVTESEKSIILMTREDAASLERGGREGGEAPPAILIRRFITDGPADPASWTQSHPELSNWNLKTSEAGSTTVAGLHAVEYEADGLYSSRNVVFAKDGAIYHLSGSFLDRNSLLYRGFSRLVRSLIVE